MGLNWNFAKAYQTVEGLMDTYLGRGELAKRMDQFANSDNGFGIHPKKDIIDSLDGRFHVIQRLDTQDDTSITQQVLIALELKDEAKVKKILSKIAKSEDSRLETYANSTVETSSTHEVGEESSFVSAVTSGQLVITNDVPAARKGCFVRKDSRRLWILQPIAMLQSTFPPRRRWSHTSDQMPSWRLSTTC